MKLSFAETDEPPSSEDPEPLSRRFAQTSPNSRRVNEVGASASVLKKFRTKFLRLFGYRSNSLEEEVAELIDEHDPEGTQVTFEERNLLHNVLEFGDKKVHDVMIPRTDIVAIAEDTSFEHLKETLLQKEHTRMPVYKDSLDNVVGFLHIKDLIPLLGGSQAFKVEDFVREILFVPPSMKIIDLLIKMRSKRVHMALVLDEYGGTDGLVTMEDLMEEIVGEIEDEHDALEEIEVTKIDDNTIEVNARMHVDDLESELGEVMAPEEAKEDFETVGGLVFYLLGRVPDQGETFTLSENYECVISSADPRRIKKVLIRKIP